MPASVKITQGKPFKSKLTVFHISGAQQSNLVIT